jgi:hypothetical protein
MKKIQNHHRHHHQPSLFDPRINVPRLDQVPEKTRRELHPLLVKLFKNFLQSGQTTDIQSEQTHVTKD